MTIHNQRLPAQLDSPPALEPEVAEQSKMMTQRRIYDRPGPENRPSARPRVVVIGAGFGGLSVARHLARADVDVLIVDRNNYHGFWPLLYQVATAGLEPESIAHPVRAIIRKYPNVGFRMTEVRHVDFEHKQVLTDSTPISYDYLVLAAGSANNYFGNDTLAERTYGLKDIDDAERLRNRVLSAFERAISESDPERRSTLMTFVVVGGGPTGVELAGAFIELIRHVLKHDYPVLDVSEAHVVLVEGMDSVLAAFPIALRRKAEQRLQTMGVDVRLQTLVTSVEGDCVTFKDGSQVRAGTVVWAAGVRAALLSDSLDVSLGRGARVRVEPTLNLADHPEVFVVGDMAYLEKDQNGQAYPMVAQVAIQQGKQAAKNIVAQTFKRPMLPFRYVDKGSMATIGRRSAVLDAFGVRLSGYPAWLGWLFVHLMALVGFRNRIIVLTNWAYNYFTYDRGVRLITGAKECD
ncbi:MAG: NAD(P)/FAD-dependent oxidoreductase [Chloroflexales bacterium]|nr:NAD(P)/FAD-dependent oxidoreductase [Chloroflexales bacterium]